MIKLPGYNYKETEEEILSYWNEQECHKKAKELVAGRKPFYFLDGPPYTSGRVHIGTAWNKALKDLLLRYKRLRGFDVWDRAGYDMHGMPTELATAKELGLKTKKDIEKYGISKFVTACKDLAIRNMKLMNEDFKRLGVWMDFDNPYMPIKKEFIEGEWWLIKQAHKNNRLYEGEKTMTWCASCATALAKHELEYKKVTDKSIFLKFPVKGKEKEFLVIWTTTPWTIPFNLGVMVNPELEYIKAKVDDEIWIVAKALAGPFISSVAEKSFEIIEELKGEKLKGLSYKHPLYDELKEVYEEVKKQCKNPEKVHSVVLSEEYVDLSAGTGLVHMAPGCGPEDYEVGYREGIAPFNNLNEQGIFPETMGKFSGFKAKEDDKKFIKALEETGMLIAKTDVEHDYAHCWRCKQPVIFRTTTQWFFKIEDIKEEMRELNKKIKWVPEFAGTKNFDSWLKNLRDNGITRQRYWGTPLPVWKCGKCGSYDVFASVRELSVVASVVPEKLHKPWIDEISYKCKCGGIKKRIPDILDVWIDSGSASWNCLNYPHRKDLFEKLYPADFILEGIDQIRGWFNLLFVASMVSMHKPSFKAVYMHGFVQDAQGRKMSKSLGNYILPEEVIEKYGADTLRYYMISCSSPGIDINYNFDDMRIKNRNLNIIWNLKNYIVELARLNSFKPKPELLKKAEDPVDRYMLSKLHSTIKKTTEALDSYLLNAAPQLVEALFLELSRSYIQLVRDKLASDDSSKELIFNIIYEAFFKAVQMFSIVCPFISEKIFLEFKEAFGFEESSIFHFSWPCYEEKLIDRELEQGFEKAKDIAQGILKLREKIGYGVRWPLRKAFAELSSEKPEEKRSIQGFKAAIMKLTNIKELSFEKPESKDSIVKEEHKSMVVAVDKELDDKLRAEGLAREITRRIQNLRKKNRMKKEEKIRLCISIENNGIKEFLEEIRQKVGAETIELSEATEGYEIKSAENIKGTKAVIAFSKT